MVQWFPLRCPAWARHTLAFAPRLQLSGGNRRDLPGLTHGDGRIVRTIERTTTVIGSLDYRSRTEGRFLPKPSLSPATSSRLAAAQKEYRWPKGGVERGRGRASPKKDGTQMAPSSLKSQWWIWVARQKFDPHLPRSRLRDSFGTWVYEEYGVKQAEEWLGHGDPATTLRHYVRLTTAARAKAVAGLDEVTRAALEGGDAGGRGGRRRPATSSSWQAGARRPASNTLLCLRRSQDPPGRPAPRIPALRPQG